MIDKLRRPIAIFLRVFQALAPLLARILIGQAFAQTGWGKWGKINDIVSFFTDLGIPFPAANAYFTATLEFLGGVAILLGVGTRGFALLLCGTMSVALMTADREALMTALSTPADAGLIDVAPLAYLSQLLWLVAFGAGPFSADWVVKKIIEKRSKPPAPDAVA